MKKKTHLVPQKMVVADLRATGRTTRIIDRLVQELFETGSCKIADHHPTHEADRYLLHRLMGRLEAEHHLRAAKPERPGIPFIKISNYRPHEYSPGKSRMVTHLELTVMVEAGESPTLKGNLNNI